MREMVAMPVTGTGSDIDVDLGFTPDYVRVLNRSKLGVAGNEVQLEWFGGMGEDNAIATNAIQDDSATTTYNITDLTTYGIELVSGSEVQTTDPVTFTGFHGIRIPSEFQSDGDEMYVLALRN